MSFISMHCISIGRRFPESARAAISVLFSALEDEENYLLLEETISALATLGYPVLPDLQVRYAEKKVYPISLLAILRQLPFEEAAAFMYKYRQEFLQEKTELFLKAVFQLGHVMFIDFLQAEWRPGEHMITETLLLLCELHQREIPQLPELRREYREAQIDWASRLQALKQGQLPVRENAPLSLKLRCKDCNRIYTYEVSKVSINSSGFAGKETGLERENFFFKEAICCKNCGVNNRYEFTNEAMITVMGELMYVMAAKKAGQSLENCRVDLVTSVLADGTPVNSYAEAIEHYANKVHGEPNRADLRILYGNVLRRCGQGAEALRQYKRACQLDYLSIEAHYNLLTLNTELKQENKAVDAGMILLEIAKKRAGNLSEDELEMVQDGKEIMIELVPGLENPIGQLIEGFPKSKSETYRRMEPKIGRNDPCFCGSGKKYKKCCGKQT